MAIFLRKISNYLTVTLVLILIIVSINLFITFLPLTKTLGYEFSVINSILFFFTAGIHVIIEQRKNFVIGLYPQIINNKNFLIFSVSLPFIIGLFSSLIQTNCPIYDGILFYLVISIPALFFGAILGNFCVVISNKYSLPVFILIFLIILVAPLFEFYLYPQIYFFNPIFGFFPGTIYDEDLSVDKILLAYRIINLAFFILLYYLSHQIVVRKYRKSLVIFLSLTIVITFSILKPALLFATNTTRIKKNLNNEINSENFSVYSAKSVIDENNIKFISLLHEYYLDRNKEELNIKPKGKIESFIFLDKDQKRKLLGSGNADIAKPWLNHIYLNNDNFDKTLNHEIIHVLAGEFGVTPFKVSANINPAMIEGFAMAVENNYDGFPVHYMAKLAYQSGYKFPIEKLFSGLNFFSQTSSISYVYAGSFLKYLADTYGIIKLKRVYGDNNFSKIFSKDFLLLGKDYEEYLKKFSILYNKYQAQLYFSGTTIFKKYCPRMAAADVKKAWSYFTNQNFNSAFNLFQKVYNYSSSFQSLTGLISCYVNEKNYLKAEKFLSEQIANFKSSQYYFYLELVLGDLLIRTNQLVRAIAIYDSLFNQNPHIDFTNEILIRKTILKEGIDSLKTYFAKSDDQKLQKLLALNDKNLFYSSIPLIIKFAVKESFQLNDFINNTKKRIKVVDYISSYASMEISRYALRNLDYELAQYYAVKSLDYKTDYNSNYRFIENFKMINWFKNNGDEIKITLSNNEF